MNLNIRMGSRGCAARSCSVNLAPMCTLFNQLTTTQAMIDLRAEFERLNIPPLYGIYPDYNTPIARSRTPRKWLKH